MNSYEALPDNLPRPVDDGACNHLVGMELPKIKLLATDGSLIDLSSLPNKVVIYCYPMTGKPGVPLPHGWDEIPGARGCTPQTCSYRDHHKELAALGADVFGLSTQASDYQQEMADTENYPASRHVVEKSQWRTAFLKIRIDSDVKEASVKKDFERQSQKLQEDGFIHSFEDKVWIVHDEDRQDI